MSAIKAHAMPPAALTRYRAIDGFRFLAALGIVLHHYTRYSEHAFWALLFAKNYLFVDLFFVISGFVIMLAYGDRLRSAADYASFLQNRLARVYPLHLAMFAALLLMDMAAWSGLYHPREAHPYDPGDIAANVLLVEAWGFVHRLSYNYPSWSISAEWMLYLLFPAVVLAFRRGGALLLFGLAAVMVLALEALGLSGRIPTWTTLTYDFGYFRAIPTFLVGAGLCCAVEQSARIFHSLLWPAAFFASAVAGMVLGWDDRFIITLFVLLVASATGAERAGARNFLTGPFMGRLGDWSYALYMIHALVGVLVVGTVGPRLLHLTGWAMDGFIAACIGLCTVLAAGVYHWLEVPAREMLRDRGGHERVKSAVTPTGTARF